MKWLFIYAHPDDESVAAGGTIPLLINKGESVKIILATHGESGHTEGVSQGIVKKAGGIKALRKKEFNQACQILGVKQPSILDYHDSKCYSDYCKFQDE